MIFTNLYLLFAVEYSNTKHYSSKKPKTKGVLLTKPYSLFVLFITHSALLMILKLKCRQYAFDYGVSYPKRVQIKRRKIRIVLSQ